MASFALSLSPERIVGRNGLAAAPFQHRRQTLRIRLAWIEHRRATVQAIRTAWHYQQRISTQRFSQEAAYLRWRLAIPSTPLTSTKDLHRILGRRVIHSLAIRLAA